MTAYFLSFPTIVVHTIRTVAYDRLHQAAQVDAGIQQVSPRSQVSGAIKMASPCDQSLTSPSRQTTMLVAATLRLV